MFAKMGAVCDVYDAITSNRPYKQGWDPAESIARMAGWAKGHFDSAIFKAFVTSLGIYPTGSLVRLKSGLLAVVTRQNDAALTAPEVKVFFSFSASPRRLNAECTRRRRGSSIARPAATAAGSRSSATSLPAAPNRARIARLWPPRPNVAST